MTLLSYYSPLSPSLYLLGFPLTGHGSPHLLQEGKEASVTLPSLHGRMGGVYSTNFALLFLSGILRDTAELRVKWVRLHRVVVSCS